MSIFLDTRHHNPPDFVSEDSALVYTEFMGIIKGSETSLYKSRRYLDKKEYEEQNNRSVLGDGVDKAKIYSMFQSYEKIRPPASYDVADRFASFHTVDPFAHTSAGFP